MKKLTAMVDTRNQEFWHADLMKPRIFTDEGDELSDEELCRISTGSVPSLIAINDMHYAKKKG